MITDDSDEFTIPALPPRSTLHHLEPVGVGTPEVESLTGYIARLCESHSNSVYAIFKSFLVPLLGQSTIFMNQNGVGKSALILNGTGFSADNAVRALETLTMRTELRMLTLLPWSVSLSNNHLVKRNRVWCPACYEDLRTRNKTIYEPLIWTFNAVEVCASHGERLRSECPHCGRSQLWLSNTSRPGHCSKCGRWLGVLRGGSGLGSDSPDPDMYEYQKWVVENIGDVLAAAPHIAEHLPKERVPNFFSRYVDEVAKGDARAFANFIEANSVSVKRWMKGARPRLSIILRICYRLNMRFLDYLTGSVDRLELSEGVKISALPKPAGGRPKTYVRHTNWEHVEEKLKTILASKNIPPTIKELSLKWKIERWLIYYQFPEICRAIAARRREGQFAFEEQFLREAVKEIPPRPLKSIIRSMAGRSHSTIGRIHPELCKALADRFESYAREEVLKNVERIRAEVREVAVSLHREGVYPSFPKVAAKLSIPSRLSRVEIRITLREVQRELGYRR